MQDPELGGEAPAAEYMAETAAHNTGYDAGTTTGAQQQQRAPKEKGWFDTFQKLHIIAHMIWIKIHHFLFGELMIRFVYGTPSQMNRRIVVIGDDYALGVGDWVTMGKPPGLQRYINDHVEEFVKKKSARIVRQGVTWSATTTAISGSTAEDWLPRSRRHCSDGRNFEGVFDANIGTDPDADIVCVLVGAHMHKGSSRPSATSNVNDTEKIMEEFSSHVETICTELCRRGKYVLISTIPLSLVAAEDELLLNNNRLKNHMIRQVVSKLRRDMPDGCDAAQLTLIDTQDALKNAVHYRFGGRLVSGAGYMAMSRGFLTAIVSCIDQVETKSIFVKKMM